VAVDDAAVVVRIVEFLRSIGLRIDEVPLDEDTFLTGIRLAPGRLEVDTARLAFAGDLLHEAGHLAVMPEAERLAGAPVEPMAELAAIPWSYAAARHLGIDPAVVFHAGGYHGQGPALLGNFELGVAPGLHLLESAGLTASPTRAEELGVAPFPHMIRWLRA
jgi:hypothetical protein